MARCGMSNSSVAVNAHPLHSLQIGDVRIANA